MTDESTRTCPICGSKKRQRHYKSHPVVIAGKTEYVHNVAVLECVCGRTVLTAEGEATIKRFVNCRNWPRPA